MAARCLNPRLAKIHQSYSVEEIARLFGAHKNTVRRWVKQGLQPIDGKRPTVVHGEELRRFLIERRMAAKKPCGPGRIYCLPCREPKVPAGRMAELVVSTKTSATLHGICPDCNRMIYRKANPEKFAAVCGDLDVAITQAESSIAETTKPNVNCDSGGDDKT